MRGFSANNISSVDFGTPSISAVKGFTFVNNSATIGYNDDFFWSSYIQAIDFSFSNLSYSIAG